VKAIVFLLVLANLLFYAFIEGYFGQPDNPDAMRVAQQVAPDAMRIVARGEAPPAADPQAVAEPPQAVGETPPVEAPARTAAEARVETLCLAWGPLTLGEAEKFSALVGERFADFRLSRQGGGDGWWVHIPPLADKAAADKKGAELKALGIGDYFIVQDGLSRNAISLGVFTTEKGGRERLAELKGKGVRSARLGLRPDKDGGVRFELSGPAAQADALQAELAAALPKRSPRDCP